MMKLSELSYREYIALEVLGPIASMGNMNYGDAVEKAFGVANAFLRHVGKHDDKIKALTLRAERAEASNSILLNMGEDGKFSVRVALKEIWEVLGAKNQTEAMEALRSWDAMTQEKSS